MPRSAVSGAPPAAGIAPGAPPPEAVGLSNRRILIAYAWGIWLYRLVLFTGIALAVYHYFFKVLGLLLFLVEIVFFIALPIWRELKVWKEGFSRISESRRGLHALRHAMAGLCCTW